MEHTGALLVASAFAFVLAAVLTCLLLLRYGFTRDADAPVGRWGVRPARIGHAVAAALFGSGLVLAVIALTAAPLSGRENYLAERLRERVERLRARLGSVRTVVDHLSEGTETVRRLVFPETRARAVSGDAPAVGVAGRDAESSPAQAPGETPATLVSPSIATTAPDRSATSPAPSAEPPMAVSAPPRETAARPRETVREAVPEARSVSIIERLSSAELRTPPTAGDSAHVPETPPPPAVRPPAEPAPQPPDARQRGDNDAANPADVAKPRPDRERDTSSDDRSGPARKAAREERDPALDRVPSTDPVARAQTEDERRDRSQLIGRGYGDSGAKDEGLGRSEGASGPGSSPRSDRYERSDLSKRPEKLERSDRRERVERLDRVDRLERPERVERPERPERPERLERLERVERLERPDRIERLERRGR